MRRALKSSVLALAILTLMTTASGNPVIAQERIGFKLGFATLASMIPGIAGQPVEEEWHNPENGDGLQRTTTGLMVWRKADNWTAFTDGTTTWINGPFGLQSRPNGDRFDWEGGAGAGQTAGQPQSDPVPSAPPSGTPRVNVYPDDNVSSVEWADASVFWFGRVTEQENYVDVRATYDETGLHIAAAVIDYHFWYDESAGSDPRGHDAVSIYLDTDGDRATAPDAADYLLVSGFRHWPVDNDSRWHRQARGNGSSWDYSWRPDTGWTDRIGLRYDKSGSNDNSDRDAGWWTTITVPWGALSRGGPPAPGTTWGLGVTVHDRDEAMPAGMVPPKSWPANLSEAMPHSWGVLAFDPPAFTTPDLNEAGTTLVRRGVDGASVEDAYVGGGGSCAGGKFGGGDVPHPRDDLFVQNQSDTSDFPCFSKSYLKFDISSLPRGKRILSATLRVYGFGGSDPSQAVPSGVQLFSVGDDWDEGTVTWNNAPTAHENLDVAQVGVIKEFPGWPGVPTEWDATKAVVEAYGAGRPVSLALYSADVAYHSGKYFVSSDTGDWNAEGRPSLIIKWAN